MFIRLDSLYKITCMSIRLDTLKFPATFTENTMSFMQRNKSHLAQRDLDEL